MAWLIRMKEGLLWYYIENPKIVADMRAKGWQVKEVLENDKNN